MAVIKINGTRIWRGGFKFNMPILQSCYRGQYSLHEEPTIIASAPCFC